MSTAVISNNTQEQNKQPEIINNIIEIDALSQLGSGDEADQASLLESYEREMAVRSILDKKPKELPPDFDGCCVECGDEIPPYRLEKLKSTLCVHCQEIIELKQKRK